MGAELKVKILLKLDEIDNTLCKDDAECNDLGVLSGTSGLILYHAYRTLGRSKYDHNVYIETLIKSAFNKINQGYSNFSFCSGIAGFSWSMLQLVHKNIFTIEQIGFLSELDKYLEIMMNKCLKNKYYDYLHGSIGLGVYFLKKAFFDEKYKYLVQSLVEQLEYISVNENNKYIYWQSEIDKENKKVGVNLSLSHGQSSIIIYLCNVYNAGICKAKAKNLVYSNINYILTLKRDISKFGSFFPSTNFEPNNEYKSRLAWCYGDLGFGLALYKAANTFNQPEWFDIALQILLHSSKRTKTESEMVIDAGICHGSAGLCHIFWQLFINTQKEEFKEAMLFWLDQTLNIDKHKNGYAGYKVWMGSKYGGWKSDYSLLEGVAGIGFVLSSLITNQMDWNECLMLN